MTDSKKEDSSDKLRNIQQSFKLRLSAKIDDIRSCWKVLEKESSPDFTHLHLLLHSLVGTSGTYSAVMVSGVTRKLEVIVKAMLNNEISLSGEIVQKIDNLFEELQLAADKWQPSTIPFIPEEIHHSPAQEPGWNSNIYLVEDDVEIVLPLIDFLEKNGYKIFYYRDIQEFEYSYDLHEQAAAIIMDMAFKEGHIAGAETINRLSDEDDDFPPVLFISVHDDIEARLAAAKAGSKRYFTKPLNYNALLVSLDNLTRRKIPEAYRVLLIDDEQDELDYYSAILQQHGFETLACSNPLEAYAAIKTFKADIIILDLYMPECSGLELARVIRQNDEFAHIPIVFLSAELDTGTQLSALDLGGDDFFMKPVDPSHFVQAIIARVKRSRRIHNLNNTLHDTIRESEYRLATLDQHAIVCITDMDGNITHVNEHLLNISGYKEEELLDQRYTIFKTENMPEEMWSDLSKGSVWHGQFCNYASDGTAFWLELTIVPFIDSQGKPYKYVFAGTDVTRLKITEAELIEAKEEAEHTNNAKTNFLSAISHELRTPINAICGFAQLLKSNDEDNINEIQMDYVNEIIQASGHLLMLINDTLNLSKIESGNIDFTIEKVHLSDVILESMALISVLAEEKNIEFIFKSEGKVLSIDEFSALELYIEVDRVRIKQVLLNLLSNAVKYNKEQGSVIIGYEHIANHHIRINIIDTGKGIARKLLPQLFTEFNRLGEDESEIEGAGIGLMITRNLAELMNGKIGVESEQSKGSTFWLEFTLTA